MRVYYLVDAQWAVQSIRDQRLKACRFFDLNDPFELLASNQGDRTFRKVMKPSVVTLSEQWGLLCFTTSWRSTLMWSHYGERHKGICLGFDIDDNILEIINYVGARVPPAGWARAKTSGSPDDVGRQLLTTKYVGWKYEDERRVLLPLKELQKQGKLFFKRFDDQVKLVQVIAGPRCCIGWKACIENAIDGLSVKPQLVKARLAFKLFQVVKQQRGFEDTSVWQLCGDTCPKRHDSPRCTR